MGLQVRPELSEKNPYHIPKHKFYELIHFCLQYPDWIAELDELQDGYTPVKAYGIAKGTYYSNPVEKIVIYRQSLEEKIKLIEDTTKEASEELAPYLLKSVTTDVVLPNGKVTMIGYDWLKTHMDIPCGKDMFYDARHRFFWLLRQKK